MKFAPVQSILPGLALSLGVAGTALAADRLQRGIAGIAWLDAVVLAIIAGTLVHTLFGLGVRMEAGVRFASKWLLEAAIVCLGASVSIATISATGYTVAGIVALVVAASLLVSYGIGRLLGLSDRLAILVACGNSICGNSAIVATAPVIDAKSCDVASSIAFTAALGVVVVLTLPLAFHLSGLSQWQYGVMAGLTVYAVPQVLAATLPVGVLATEIGTIVKLVRVLMLGPVILVLGLLGRGEGGRRPPLHHLLPWFILGFLAMAGAQSAGLIPEAGTAVLRQAALGLTVVSMAALGLSVDLKAVVASGGKVLATGALSILALAAMSAAALLVLPQI